MIKLTITFTDDGENTNFKAEKEDEGKITMSESIFAMVTMYKVKEANDILVELSKANSKKEFDKILNKYNMVI